MTHRPEWRLRALAWSLAAAVLCLACASPEERLTEHLSRADAYAEAEKYEEAVLEYRSALKIDPNHAGAHYGLARAYMATKQAQKAYWELQETVRLDPDNQKAKLQLVQFLLFGDDEDLEQAVRHAGELIEADDGDAAAWLLRGEALTRLERFEEALASYEGAVERAPEEPGALLVLANFHRAHGQAARAEELYRRLVRVEPGFKAGVALAAFLASDGDRDDEAEAAYRAARDAAAPEEQAAAHAALANFLWARGRRDAAEEVLRGGIDRTTEGRLDLIYLLARLYQAQGRSAEADGMIEEATRADPGDALPWLVLSSYRARQGDLDGALDAADRAIEADAEEPRARLRRAELLVDIGHRRGEPERFSEGRAIVDGILAVDAASPEALFVRAKVHLAEGRLEEAETDLRRAADARADWAQAHMLLGSTLFLQGDAAQARVELSRALELDADLVEAQKVLARVHAALGDHQASIDVGRRALARGEDPALRIQIAQELVRLHRVDEALAELSAIPEEARDAEAWYAMGRVHTVRREPAETRAAFERALALEPHRYEVLRGLLQLDVHEGRVAESLERVRASLAERPDDARLTRLRGEAALFAGDGATAEASFQRALELDPNDVASIESLARYLLVAGRQEEVLETYRKAIERNPRSATLHLMLASLHEVRAEPDQAIAAYEEAIRLDPALAAAKNNLAYLLADTGRDLDRALDLAQDAKEQLPDSPNASDTLGWVLYKKNEPAAALFHLRDAVERMREDDPQRGIVQQHLALAYEAHGDLERARSVVRDALDDLEERRRGAEPAAPEPPWAVELRAMAERLETP